MIYVCYCKVNNPGSIYCSERTVCGLPGEGELPMNTIRCPECDEPLPGTAKLPCPVCGVSSTLFGHQSDDERLEIRQSTTWRKEIAPSPDRTHPVPLPPRPTRSRPPMWNTWRRIRHQICPSVIVWISFVLFLLLIFGGVFGIVVTRGSGVSTQAANQRFK